VVQFFENRVFAAARPKGQEGGLGAGVTLRDAIAASVSALEKGFENQPLVEARLRNALGITLSYLGDPQQACEQFERAKALVTRLQVQEHPVTLSSMMNLATSYAALNRNAEALKLREETLAILKRVMPQDHPVTLTSMMNLASSYGPSNATPKHSSFTKRFWRSRSGCCPRITRTRSGA
jgi:eukaryotic-like serine/threonine-protein kinase